MTDIRPSQYIIGIIIFAFCIVGGITIINEFSATDSTFIQGDKYSNFTQTFNKYDDVSEEIGGLDDDLKNAEPETGLFGFMNGLVSTAWNMLVNLFSIVDFMDEVFNGISAWFDVPKSFIVLLTLAISVIITFAILSAIFQRSL